MTDDLRVRAPHLADAADIIHWSERVESRTELPRLVRRLIQANNDQVVQLEMRSAEGAGVPGYDGTVVANHATWFVPDGLSYWELGAGAEPQNKANSDYRTRTATLGDGVQSDAIFVFVTSRRWPGKVDWAASKRAEQRWRDVRAFDVDELETALEAAPAVHVWFSEMVGKPARGAQSVDDWWARFASRTRPALTPELVLAGRENTAEELIRHLELERRILSIGSKSVEDDLGFVAATILSMDEDSRSKLLGRTLIVRDTNAIRWLDGTHNLVLLVPFEDPLGREAESVRHYHVVFLVGEDSPADIALPPIDQTAFARQLISRGVAEDAANRLAQGAHRSLRRFQRLARKDGGARVSEWVEQLRSRVVRRAWLAGGWNTGKSGDTDVLSALFRQDYREAANELWQAARAADPLFAHVGGIWAVISPEDSWEYCRSQLNTEDLLAVESAIQTVLGSVDPALELPVEDRWKASIYGKSRVHTSSLREGLATTLALLGAFGDTVALGEGTTAKSWAERVTFTLLDRANKDASGQLWTSLSDVLPLLAEAAPSVFLHALQRGLEGDDPVLKTQFIDEGDRFSVSSPHTGLLWALETLAWSGDYFGLSIDLLARLAEIDPGGRLSNRPAKSLADIFRPWMPQTSVDSNRRKVVLRALVERRPGIGWPLLLSLLPEHQGIGMYTHAPRFSAWKTTEEGVTYQELWDFTSAVSEHIFTLAKSEPSRWSEIAPRLSDLPSEQRLRAYAQLEELADEELANDVRLAIWDVLSKELRRHRSFVDAPWALPASELDRLGSAIEGLAPENSIHRHRWLFHDQFPDVGLQKRNEFDSYAAEVARLRSVAAMEILDHAGLPGILELASQVDQPWALGATLASTELSLEPEQVIEFLDADEPKHVELAFAYVAGVSKGRLEWLLPLAETMTARPLVQARLLSACQDMRRAWDAAKQLGTAVDQAYWKGFRTFGRGGDFALVNEAARQLIDHGRPAAGLDLASLYINQAKDSMDPHIIAEGFEALLTMDDPEIRLLSSWDIDRLLVFLRSSSLDEEELALLEWRLLPVIGIEGSSPILERRLARDPAFYVEILSLAFKPRTAEIERQIDPRVAVNAYRLLQSWRQIPGSERADGEVNADRLRAWMAELRPLLIQADRLKVGELHVGMVFAHSRIDNDGTWPTRPIRDVIEELGSTDLESGFQTGTFNKRGVTSRGLDQGGDQERALADVLDVQANAIMDQWPRTAAILRSLAGGYRAEARTHDDEANRFRQGIDR